MNKPKSISNKERVKEVGSHPVGSNAEVKHNRGVLVAVLEGSSVGKVQRIEVRRGSVGLFEYIEDTITNEHNTATIVI